MYIRLFDQFIRLGGNPEAVQRNSPIEKTLSQFYSRRPPLEAQKPLPRTASTQSETEPPDSILITLERTPRNSILDTNVKIDQLSLLRKRLVRAFEIIEVLVQREELKFEIWKNLFD